LNPKNYNLYHFFEKNLTLSPVASPCASLFGFTKYDSTVTHGFGPVSVTLDLYDLPNESFVSARYALPELSLMPLSVPRRTILRVSSLAVWTRGSAWMPPTRP
jgi:hypothetical protein